MSGLHFGVHFPAGQQRHDALAAYVARVDELGYDSIWLIENLGPKGAGYECLTTLGYLAASSSRLRFGTSVLLLPLRNPVIAARAAATLDHLSGGRFIFGIGTGDGSTHEAVGADRRTRGRRCEETLALMRRLWTETGVTFEGEFARVKDYTLGPKPGRSSHPPIWIGGHSDVTLRRAARHADGYIPVGDTPEECGVLFDRMDAYAGELGRGPLTRAVHTYLGFADSPREALRIGSRTLSERYGRSVSLDDARPHLLGGADECRRVIEAFRRVGVTHFVCDPVCRPEDTLSHAERFAREVMPAYRRDGAVTPPETTGAAERGRR